MFQEDGDVHGYVDVSTTSSLDKNGRNRTRVEFLVKIKA
jgi:hypothetical protein